MDNAEFERDVQELSNLIESGVDKCFYMLERANLYWDFEHYELAIRDCSSIIAECIDREQILSGLRIRLICNDSIGEKETEIILDLEKIHAMGELNQTEYEWMGFLKSERGENFEALAILDEGLEKYPNTINIMMRKTRVFFQMGLYDEVISNGHKLIGLHKVNIERAVTLYWMGKSYIALGSYDLAFQVLTQLVQLSQSINMTLWSDVEELLTKARNNLP
jgi:tetratricopeptide (TPR) repeat protein